jgi:hypothetical protein
MNKRTRLSEQDQPQDWHRTFWDTYLGDSDKIKRVHFRSDTDSQKLCVPGPNVKFGKVEKDGLPLQQYLENARKSGSLGCSNGRIIKYQKYPKYIDGKYCCADAPATDQELFDYINHLLTVIVDTVDEPSLNSNKGIIEYLIRKRNQLMKSNINLTDDLDTLVEEDVGSEDNAAPVKYSDVVTWYANNLHKRPPSGGRIKTRRKSRQNKKSRTSRTRRKSRRK